MILYLNCTICTAIIVCFNPVDVTQSYGNLQSKISSYQENFAVVLFISQITSL